MTKPRYPTKAEAYDIFDEAIQTDDAVKAFWLMKAGNLKLSFVGYNKRKGYVIKVGRPKGSQKFAEQVTAALDWIEQNVPDWRDQKPYTVAGLAIIAGYSAGKSDEASRRRIAGALKAKK